MGEASISIIGTADVQQIITGLHQINGQVLALNNGLKKQSALARKAGTAHKTAGAATKGHSSAMKGLALRFVGYNLVMNMVMGAQQKLTQLIGDSITKFREFETRLAEISTILQTDVDQMDRFKVGIENLATTYGQSTSDISKGLYDILSAAFSTTDAMNLLNTSIKASIAGLSDVRTSVKIFTTVLNSYGKSAEQATHVSDVLFQAVVRGKFQFADLEQALGYVVPIAAQAGISFDELSAALSTATRHGLHVDMTARGLALAIQGIINPSAQAKTAAMEYGVEMNGLSLRVLGLKGWFDQLGTAMDKYGKSILGELIPNMRSLRVAMVLAGEEGALGFAEDLLFLENVSGRTGEALEKIMDTSAVAAKKLDQELELRFRSIGDNWDSLALTVKSGTISIIDNWMYLIPIVGQIKKVFDDISDSAKFEKMGAIIKKYPETDDAIKQIEQYINALKDSQNLSIEMADMDVNSDAYKSAYEELEIYDAIMAANVDTYNEYVGAVKDTQDALGQLEINLDEIELDIKRLNKELSDPIEVGWTITGDPRYIIEGTLALELKQLEMAQKLKDSQHDVKMGLIDSTYGWKTNNTALQEAVEAVKAHEDAQKKDTIATNKMTIAMRLLQIEALEIQLSGMLKRRGLSRTEQKQLKQIQIEQAKLRLENMKATKDETVEMYDNYEDKKQFIADFLAGLEEESYQLKYKYDYDIAELNTFIDSEKEALETRKGWWEITNREIFDTAAQLILDLEALPDPVKAFMAEEDISIPDLVASAIERQEKASEGQRTYGNYISDVRPLHEVLRQGESPHALYTSTSGEKKTLEVGAYNIGDLVSFQRGIEYMPETMPIMAHRGESIIPAGKDAGGGETIIEHVTIQVKEIAEIGSAEKMAAILSEATDRRIISSATPRARNKKAGNTYRVI